jgi:hypothetical protein
MPKIAHLDMDRITFEGTDGQLYELRGLPLSKRDLFIRQWGQWRTMAQGIEDLGNFIACYDRLMPDGTPNPNHDAEFRRATDWLLQYVVATDPITDQQSSLLAICDAATVVGLLLSKDGGKSVIEAIEFPERKPKQDAELLPEDVDATTHLMAALIDYCGGDAIRARQLASEMPYGELMALLDEHNRLLDKAQGKQSKHSQGGKDFENDIETLLGIQNNQQDTHAEETKRKAKAKVDAEFASDMQTVIHQMMQLQQKEKDNG